MMTNFGKPFVHIARDNSTALFYGIKYYNKITITRCHRDFYIGDMLVYNETEKYIIERIEEYESHFDVYVKFTS